MYGLAMTGAPVMVYGLVGLGLLVSGAVMKWHNKISNAFANWRNR